MGVRKQGYTPKKRNNFSRKRASIVVIEAEGNNKTETLYFKKFGSNKVKIIFAGGNATDPVNMINELITECRERDFAPELGDKAYCLIDSDVNSDKDEKIAQADIKAQNHDIEIIVSNPCFEQWFMCHFGFSARKYVSSSELVKVLATKIPNYSKTRDDLYELLLPNIDKAIDAAKRLEEYNLKDNRKPHTALFQPSTEVYKVIETVRSIEKQ